MNSVSSGQNNYNIYIADGVSSDFAKSVLNEVRSLEMTSSTVSSAVNSLDNIIILKDINSTIPPEFEYTENKFHNAASEAYGFVSKKDNAIVIVQDNHLRKDETLEGNILSQGADTLSHEIGHLVDKELSTTDEFKNAYLKDLKNIEQELSNPDAKIGGRDFKEMLQYLHHYTEGVDFSDGIDESDITREGVRENFAECFSNLVDEDRSEINEIYLSLFPNCANTVKRFCGII